MHPIDIQNALDRVNAGERLLHVRKVENGENAENFAKRLNEEAEQKRTGVTEAEQTEGEKIEEDGKGKNQYEEQNNKKKREEKSEGDTRVKEEGKGNILDLDA